MFAVNIVAAVAWLTVINPNKQPFKMTYQLTPWHQSNFDHWVKYASFWNATKNRTNKFPYSYFENNGLKMRYSPLRSFQSQKGQP
jgi:hypothetical protein